MSCSLLIARQTAGASQARNRFVQPGVIRLALLVAAVLPAPSAYALDRTWNPTVGMSWSTPENWFPEGVPAANDDVRISNGGTAQLTQAGQARQVRLGPFGGNAGTLQISGSGRLTTSFVEVGDEAMGTLNVENGGQISGGSAFIAILPEAIGTATVSGSSSSWTNTGDLHVGFGGTGTPNSLSGGTLLILSGGTVTNATGRIATTSGSTGTVIVDALSTWTNSSGLNVGVSGTGSLYVLNGSRVTSSGGGVGNNFNSVGTVTVESGSSWTMPLGLSVGSSVGARGTLNIHAAGSQPTLVSNGQAWVGNLLGSHGEVTVSGGAAAWRSSLDVFVGGAGTGIINVTSGGLVTGLSLNVGRGGTVNATEGTVMLTNDSSAAGAVPGSGVYVGTSAAAQGRLEISDGGKLTSSQARIDGPEGTFVTLNGAGSDWTNFASLVVGRDNRGRLNINGGANVFTGRLVVGDSSSLLGTSVGVVDVNASTLDVAGDLTSIGNFGNGTLNITNGGKVEAGGEFSIGTASGVILSGSGNVTVDGSTSSLTTGTLMVGKQGTGTLTISNGAKVQSTSVYIGREEDSQGTAVVGPNATWENFGAFVIGSPFSTGKLDIRQGGTVKSVGWLIRNQGTVTGEGTLQDLGVAVFNQGKLAPGSSPGTLTIEGNYTQDGSGTLEIELASPTSYDVLAVTGQASLGGTLEIKLLDGYTPAPNHTFNFLTASSFTGNFSNVVVNSASGQGGSFNVNVTPGGLQLSNFQATPGAGGLVAHWDAENGAADVTGNGHDGIFRGNAGTTTDGPFGNAFTFDGNGDYIEIGDELDMGASDFTLAAWIKGDPAMNQWARILDKGYFSAYELGRTSFAHTVGFTYMNSDPSFTSSSSVIDNTWHHIAVVKSGTTATVYADGVAENTVSVSSAAQDNALPLLIGYNPGEGLQGAWMGLLDELRIYDRALGASEIAELAMIPDVGLPGDFNGDGIVDAADYVVWRKNGLSQAEYNIWRTNFGRTNVGESMPGDFNLDGTVDAADYVEWRKSGGTPAEYNLWRNNFGRTSGSGGLAGDANSQSGVPEPASALLLFTILISALTRRSRCVRSIYPYAAGAQTAHGDEH